MAVKKLYMGRDSMMKECWRVGLRCDAMRRLGARCVLGEYKGVEACLPVLVEGLLDAGSSRVVSGRREWIVCVPGQAEAGSRVGQRMAVNARWVAANKEGKYRRNRAEEINRATGGRETEREQEEIGLQRCCWGEELRALVARVDSDCDLGAYDALEPDSGR